MEGGLSPTLDGGSSPALKHPVDHADSQFPQSPVSIGLFVFLYRNDER